MVVSPSKPKLLLTTEVQLISPWCKGLFIILPSEHVFLIFKKFSCSLEIPIRKENTTELLIVHPTDILNEEFLSDRNPTIKTYLYTSIWVLKDASVYVNVCVCVCVCGREREREILLLEAFHRKHNNGADLNHTMFHLYQIELLREERQMLENIYCHNIMGSDSGQP